MLYLNLIEGNTEKVIDYLENPEELTKEELKESGNRLLLCENIVADAMLKYYKKLCEKHNITFEVSLNMPNDLPLEDTDISIILGNLLENAYHACLETDKPWIKVTGYYNDGCFMLQIENTFSSEIRKKGDKFYSTKHDGFGIGTTSIRAIAEKYDGFADFEDDGTIFTAAMTLQFEENVVAIK